MGSDCFPVARDAASRDALAALVTKQNTEFEELMLHWAAEDTGRRSDEPTGW
jgi:hypothetical protein